MARPPVPPGSVETPPHLRLVLALAPLLVVLQPHRANKGTGCLLLHRPQPESALLPMTHEPSYLRLAHLAGENVGKVPYHFWVGAHASIGVEVFLSPLAQKQPGGFYL